MIALLFLFIFHANASVVDYGPPTDAANNWLVDIYNASGVERGTSSVPFRIDPTGTTPQPATQSGVWSIGRTWTLSSGADSVSASVSNFPAVQAVSQSGTWTVQQGTPPWTINLTQILGATPTATNYLPSRLTNGTSYVDPTQIRALTSADVVTANQGGAWTVTANAGTNLNTSALNLESTQAKLTISQGAAQSSQQGPLVQGLVSTASPNPNNATITPLSINTFGALRTDDSTINGTTVATGNGTSGAAVKRVVIAADNTAFPIKLSDGTNTTAVKASSTAALVSDPSAVVAFSPNSPLPTGTNSVGQVTANAGTNLNTSALALETTQVTESTRIGDVVETAPASDTASSGLNGRLQRIAQRLTSIFTAQSDRSQKTQLTNGAIDVAVSASTPVLSDNALEVRTIPYEPQTYSASAVGFTLAATATDVFTITGSATKTIRINKIRFSATTTSGSAIKLTVSLIKRSTANSAGTSVADTAVPHDSNNAAATATAVHYTANPTLGTTVGTVRTITNGVTNQGVVGGDLIFEFAGNLSQPIVLRGTAQQLSINLNSISITGGVASISAEWVEL